ncbi:hypothetical protein CIPAW_08G151700 [Carya illinoinensis]|uniref:Uncharacterized protein n=1 Tax=Carya illinoinensis TaxID=32201 RepID=A0A8T1PN27_CARIL|nr:hypothetical protein CIPAW_08G151700 [Carya illinoinensis]
MEYSRIDRGLSRGEGGMILFEMVLNGKWGDVVNTCTENPFFLVNSITRTNDTLLHLAVSGGQVETVQKMINIIKELPDPEKSVRSRNNRGNTALHLAAVVGNVAMCRCIAEVHPSLIVARNEEEETPLYLAVFFGKKQAFQCFYDLCPIRERDSGSRNTRTGDTILHCAISEDHFDLALRIIELYDGKELEKAVNEEGVTPLHLLAAKPLAFPSGSLLLLGFCKKIIYHCMYPSI